MFQQAWQRVGYEYFHTPDIYPQLETALQATFLCHRATFLPVYLKEGYRAYTFENLILLYYLEKYYKGNIVPAVL